MGASGELRRHTPHELTNVGLGATGMHLHLAPAAGTQTKEQGQPQALPHGINRSG